MSLSMLGGFSRQLIGQLGGRGVFTPGGVLNYPGSRTLYVRSGGVLSGDPKEFAEGALFRSIRAALKHCRAGAGDQVIALPGHVENISGADHWSDLQAGTQIVGWGEGELRPILRWTAAGASLLLNRAGVSVKNFTAQFAGDPLVPVTLTVTLPITVSAPGVVLSFPEANLGIGANQKVTRAILATDAAKRLSIIHGRWWGATAAECTTVIDLAGADNVRIEDMVIEAATSSASVGVMRLVATALVGGFISDCLFANRKAASSEAVTGVAGSSGQCRNSQFAVLNNTGLTGWSTKANWQFHNCVVSHDIAENAGLMTVVSA
ncbi:MAG: hypothetical protein QN163_10865 [Armatimonadota bacterium]|nr:hypothetical protein [Armatimonadota bacterium]